MPNIMEIIESIVGGQDQVSAEEHHAVMQHRIARIEFAFNGDDPDSREVRRVTEILKFFNDSIDRKAEPVVIQLSEAFNSFADAFGEITDKLEALAAFRLRSQGRWFTDEDGPDFKTAEEQEQEDYPLSPDDSRHGRA